MPKRPGKTTRKGINPLSDAAKKAARKKLAKQRQLDPASPAFGIRDAALSVIAHLHRQTASMSHQDALDTCEMVMQGIRTLSYGLFHDLLEQREISDMEQYANERGQLWEED